MVATDSWHDATVNDIANLLAGDADVLAVVLVGSCAQTPPRSDAWSDVDLFLIVKDGTTSRFHPATDWLAPLGEMFATNQSSNAFWAVTRVCFTDFRRVDVGVTTESALARIAEWPSVPFWDGSPTVFSRSALVDAVLAQEFERPQPALISDDQFEAMVNDFWWKATLAATKVMRDDLLIALHLSLDLIRDCCVLGMLLRDRTEGTNHHRSGGRGNRIVEELETTRQPHTAEGILDSIERSGIAFDALAAQWSPTYREHRHPLLAWLRQARDALAGARRVESDVIFDSGRDTG